MIEVAMLVYIKQLQVQQQKRERERALLAMTTVDEACNLKHVTESIHAPHLYLSRSHVPHETCPCHCINKSHWINGRGGEKWRGWSHYHVPVFSYC